MTEVAAQEEILETFTGIKEDVVHLKEDVHYLREYIEDAHLTGEEKAMVEATLAKIKKGEKFISHQQVKKQLAYRETSRTTLPIRS